MHTHQAITGTLENGQLVRLDEPVSLPAGRVRVTLEPLPSEARTGKTLVEWIKIARGQLKKRGYHFRSKSEIDQQIHEERNAWGD